MIAKRTLRRFWTQCPDAKGPLEAWHAETASAAWPTPQQVKTPYHSAGILKGGRFVFNIGGNKYRLVVAIDYAQQTCFIKFIGTHQQYDAINAETVHYENITD